jgi:heme/copper-type cytochrome/quinol oxidase subunit 4
VIPGGSLDPLIGWPALFRSVQYLYVHGSFVAVLAIVLTLLSWIKNYKIAKAAPLSWLTGRFISIAAFGFLGFSLAYVLSLGVDKDHGTNTTLTIVATALVPLITGGIAYIETDRADGTSKPRTGIVAFLICFAVCFQTFYYQLTYSWPTSQIPH